MKNLHNYMLETPKAKSTRNDLNFQLKWFRYNNGQSAGNQKNKK
jgi:hypothetical protein